MFHLFILFADDTNIVCSGSDIVQLSIELDKLSEWFAVNTLSLNLSKTNFMLFTNCKREQNVNISINNCEIDMVYKTKFFHLKCRAAFYPPHAYYTHSEG